MKMFDKKGKVLKNFNDSKKDNYQYEIGEDFVADRFRYDELFYKGYVTEGVILEDKKEESTFNFKKEEK